MCTTLIIVIEQQSVLKEAEECAGFENVYVTSYWSGADDNPTLK